ncbi:hypothetical protein [Nocardioides jishulii]|uniref:Ig-like domain-containing protein n=1 Tax=Nocardioides jishulii TaxID=2575440 RepID=A0A4U2YII1_9ACTN|nr:hypothetical protein [Nocardioides jishulii]QCX28242.1 hypothetical protein FCL41_12455 [Nocardioides jishulii]TKI60906.1 hypothetical protein FC770_15525 [Nocardioides jishulii]
MKLTSTALAAASALIVGPLVGTAPAQADSDSDWRTGWCTQGEGLSVVVDFGAHEDPSIPAEGFTVRCLVGGVVETGGREPRVAALEAVGLEVRASGSYIESIAGVEEEHTDDGMSWWFFSGAAVPGPWDTANYGIVTDGPNIDRAFGARYVGTDGVSVPRPTPQFSDPEPEPVPVVTGAVPTVFGTARVGATLRALPGSWSDGVTLTYQWERNGAPIAGARSATYRVAPADRGARLTVTVTGSKPGHTPTSLESARTGTVAPGLLTARKPAVTGTTKVGKRLTARPGAWKPAQVRLTYQWLRNGKVIKGAKAKKKTYVVTKRDRRARLSVRVTGTAPGYTKVTRTSARTARVTR